MIGDAAIGKVVDGLTDAVDSVTRVAGKAVRDKDMAERNQNAELIALWEQYRAEFGNANKGGFDAFVDGMNRLVRPVTAFSVLGAFGFLLVRHPKPRRPCAPGSGRCTHPCYPLAHPHYSPWLLFRVARGQGLGAVCLGPKGAHGGHRTSTASERPYHLERSAAPAWQAAP
jgi:hypothetical protein